MGINKKILTVVTNCYNSTKTILDTLKSLDIDSNDIDVFIINDGSADNLKEVVEPYVNKKPNMFHYFEKPNGNWGDCINFAIARANSLYISVLDSDDTYNTESLIKILEIIKSTKSLPDLLAINFQWVITAKNNKKVKTRVCHSPKPMTIKSVDKVSLAHVITIHSIMISLDIAKKIKPMPVKKYYADTYLICQSLLAAKTVGYIDKNIYLYNYFLRGNEQSISLNKSIKNYKHLETLFYLLLGIKPAPDFTSKKKKILKAYISRQLYWLMLILLRSYYYSTKEKCLMLKHYCSLMDKFNKENRGIMSCSTFFAKFIKHFPHIALFLTKVGCDISPFAFCKATRYKRCEKKAAKEEARLLRLKNETSKK